MSWHFYYQKTPESAWEIADAKDRDVIVRAVEPPFTTILDLNTEVVDGMKREDMDAIKYRGPLYFDFDSDSIEEVIPQFQKFLSKLTDIDVDLRQVELYASGGKGFHVIVPMEMFLLKPAPSGYPFLPAIYKEIAQQLYVDTLDLRVYTARRGRMFRTLNVKRTNGKYKVQLSVEQARSITPDLYNEWTSQPCEPWAPNPPVHNSELALLFTQSQDKVKELVAKRGTSKADEKLVAQFKGEMPESLKMVGRGENIREDAGFQRIATQIAITAHAIGLSIDQVLADCEGLIESHQSDGYRYNTPNKRRKELIRMYDYMQDNPCYEFSAGAIKNLLVKGTPTPDLSTPIEDEHGVLEEDDDLDIDDDVARGVRFNRAGIFCKTYDKEAKEFKLIKLAHLGLDNVSMVMNLDKEEVVGYEFDVFVEGKYRGRKSVTSNSIATASQLKTTLGSSYSVGMQMTESQAAGFLDLMRKKAEVYNNMIRNVPREGVDVIRLPDTETQQGRVEIIYAAPANLGGVVTLDGVPGKYKLQTVNGSDGEFRSDLLSAPRMDEGDTEELVKFFDSFFRLYDDRVMARVLGYYLACFLAQPLRHKWNQFPILQVYGEAGAGKTSMCQFMGSMHFYNKQPTVWSAGDMTPFALQSLLQSSGSIPVIFDEFKKRELGLKKAQDFMMIMRNSYTGNMGGKGRVNRDAGQSTLSVQQSAAVAPLIFLGEEFESQTAIVDRSIIVPMVGKKTAEDMNADWNFCSSRRTNLGKWGRFCALKALELDMDEMGEMYDDFNAKMLAVAQGMPARPIYNNVVLLMGLEFGRMTLSVYFEDRYNDKFEALKSEILNNLHTAVPRNQSEASKVLSALAALTGRPMSDPFHLELGVDYMPATDGATQEPCVDIHLVNAWDKYSRAKRSQGEEVLYNSEAAFVNALMRHRAVLDNICVDSPLKGGRPSVKVARFNLRTLYDEELVEEFKDLERAKFLS